MLKKLFLLFILISGRASAQFSKIYYPHINRAELAITRESYSEASAAYREAFANVKSPLVCDLYNATVCKILLNDFEGAKPYLLKMAIKGVSTETFEKEDVFQKVRSQWESFKPVYYQVLSTFERSLPDSVQTWAAEWKESHTDNFMRFQAVRTGSSGESLLFNPDENVTARMKLEQHLSATGGYSEEADGLVQGDYVLTPLNAIVFSPYLGTVLFRQNDSLLLATLKKVLEYQPRMNGMTYLVEGIEAGKWHRGLYRKLLNRAESVSVAYVRTEEDCGDEFKGYYISGKPATPVYPFQEEAELILAKTIFHFTRETHDFKLGTEEIMVNRKDFPSCRTAREEMQHWTPLSR